MYACTVRDKYGDVGLDESDSSSSDEEEEDENAEVWQTDEEVPHINAMYIMHTQCIYLHPASHLC